MNESLLFKIALGATGLLALALAFRLFTLKPEDLNRYEKLPRNRTWGGLLAFAALVWCIPHERVVVFDWMLPLLWPFAVAGTVLGILYLDFLLSRAVGGLLILLAYYFVHGAFDYSLPGGEWLAILMWILGIAGIALSGKPCWLRDFIRLACARPGVRLGGGVYFVLLGLGCLISLFAGVHHGL
jgi:hypothetical protein